MTRHLGYQNMPERQTFWRSIVDFWRAGLSIGCILLVILGAMVVQLILVLAAYYIGALLHPVTGVLLAIILTFFTLPLLFGVVTDLIEWIDL